MPGPRSGRHARPAAFRYPSGKAYSAGQVIPMLLEAAGVAAYGKLTAYGSLTTRKGSPERPILGYSREHWLQYRFTETISLRAGKVVLPFGLKMSDHTQYVRQDNGLDKYDQSYAVELDWIRDDFTLSAAAFAGDVVTQDESLREAGGALRGTFVLGNLAEVGVSALAGRNDPVERWAVSGHVRIAPFPSAYLLGELTRQQEESRRSTSEKSTLAAFGRVGYFVLPELDVHLEAGHRRVANSAFLTRSRVGMGANWQGWHWLELIPQVVVETDQALGTRVAAMAQLHLVY